MGAGAVGVGWAESVGTRAMWAVEGTDRRVLGAAGAGAVDGVKGLWARGGAVTGASASGTLFHLQE